MKNAFWWCVFAVALRRLRTESSLCANRITNRFTMRNFEVTVELRNTKEPDAYSREEVYRMLRTVRREEKRSAWNCPEPEL